MKHSTGKKIEHGIVISCVIIIVAIAGFVLYGMMVKHDKPVTRKAAEFITNESEFFTDKDSTQNFKFDIIITEKGG
jgi:hypothetical protein